MAGASTAHAQPVPKALASAPPITGAASPGPRRYVTRHEEIFAGRRVAYQSELAEMLVKPPSGEGGASLFAFSYTALAPDKADRPVAFVFNGGPGGAAAVLQLGALGPRRMAAFDPAAQADPATPLVDNPATLLDVADLVFIDPPETGFSRLLPGTAPNAFHTVDADSYACAAFVHRWLSERGRLRAPVTIIGESYGSLRAVAMVRELANATPPVDVDGLVLVSQAITYGTGRSRLADPLAAVRELPSAAALAWWHGRIDNRSQSVWEAVQKARVYARTEYVDTLLQGNRLPAEQRERVAARLHDLTGLSTDYYLAHDLRIGDVSQELLRDRGRVLAPNDGRLTEAPRARGPRNYDAELHGITTDMERYASAELKAGDLGRYITLNAGIGQEWNYGAAPDLTLDRVLAAEMRRLPRLRLLVTQGVFDTTTGLGSTEYTLSQIDLPLDRYEIAYYPGGHMLYASPDGLTLFTDDLRAFVQHRPLSHRDLDIRPGVPSA